MEGVGEKGSVAQREAIVPGTVVDEFSVAHTCEYKAPVVEDSPIPALLGNRSLHNLRAILDMVNDRLYLCGEGDVQFTPPPGSHVFKLRPSRSGHLLLPFTQYARATSKSNVARLMFPWTTDELSEQQQQSSPLQIAETDRTVVAALPAQHRVSNSPTTAMKLTVQ